MLHFTRPENNNNNTKGHTNGAPTEDKGLHLNCMFCGRGRGKYIYCNDNIISFPLVKCGKKNVRGGECWGYGEEGELACALLGSGCSRGLLNLAN